MAFNQLGGHHSFWPYGSFHELVILLLWCRDHYEVFGSGGSQRETGAYVLNSTIRRCEAIYE